MRKGTVKLSVNRNWGTQIDTDRYEFNCKDFYESESGNFLIIETLSGGALYFRSSDVSRMTFTPAAE